MLDISIDIQDAINSPEGSVIVDDVRAWCKWHKNSLGGDIDSLGVMETLIRLYKYYESFRSLLDYRLENLMGKGANIEDKLARATDLYLKTSSLGGGVLHTTWAWHMDICQ